MSLHKLIASLLFVDGILVAIVMISDQESTRMSDWEAELSRSVEDSLLTFLSKFLGPLWENWL
jgi:hypothetical protein